MAKNSGSTRRTAPGGNEGGGGASQPVDKFLQPAQMDRLAEIISKGGYVQIDDRELADVWIDDMTLDEKELTLMLAGFTGMINEELEENGTMYFPLPKKELVGLFVDQLVNQLDGNGMEESTMFTIGYKDGTVKYLAELDDDFSDSVRFTDKISYSGLHRKAKEAIGLSNVTFIIKSDGYDEPNYWVADDEMAKEQLRKYGGFEYWKKGRGEKRRSYIQDDWI